MKKIFATLLAVLFISIVFAQDSTVTVVLPQKWDFSTISSFKVNAQLLISAVLTIITGYWAKGNAFLKKYLPTTEKRVAFVGLLVSIFGGLLFGFTSDILTTIWASLIGVLTAMGGFGALKTAVHNEKTAQQ